MDEFQRQNPHVEVEHIDIDANPTRAQQYGVESVPTTVFLKDGREADRKVGSITYDTMSHIMKKIGCILNTAKVIVTILLFLI